ncbi:MAG TPA: radical SAM protein [Elusimicrobia bacterium]|nr:radical SAM protein [Elusimicrobiota bacterium]
MNLIKPSIVYRYGNGLYVNLTNRCPTACVFCIKTKWKMDYRGANLNLENLEPSPTEVARLAALTYAEKSFDELVFCGYGEPAMRFDAVLETARMVKSGGAFPVPAGIKIRLNTNGLANLICERNVAPELKGLVDAVHISLNASEPGRWAELMRPQARYAEKGFESVKDFIREAARVLPETIATIIDCDKQELAAFENLAAGLGAKTRVRAAL